MTLAVSRGGRIWNLPATLVPLLTLFLLYIPLSYISNICHEFGHGFLALAQGGVFTGVVIERGISFASANSYLVSIGGWIGQYTLGFTVLLLSWRLKPKGFFARSVVVIFVLQDFVEQPAYIASLYGDSSGALAILMGTGIGRQASIAVLETSAAILLIMGSYVSWRVLRTYLSNTFRWMEHKRSDQAAMILVGAYTAVVWVGTIWLNATEMGDETVVGGALFAAFVVAFLLIVPPPPSSWQGSRSRPSYAAFTVAVLLFMEAELVYFFILPVVIPFPPW